jgi:hypothetical protein
MKTLAGIRAVMPVAVRPRGGRGAQRGAQAGAGPAEMPLSTIHLENMLALSRMGVAMVPPMPAYYNHPETVDDITNIRHPGAGSVWPRLSQSAPLERLAHGRTIFTGDE